MALRRGYLLSCLAALSSTFFTVCLTAEFNFANTELVQFIKKNCAPPKKLSHTDKVLCAALERQDEEEIRELLKCVICFKQMNSNTLAMTQCGHVLDEKCYQSMIGKINCHLCRTVGARVNHAPDSVTLGAMVIFEKYRWIAPVKIRDSKFRSEAIAGQSLSGYELTLPRVKKTAPEIPNDFSALLDRVIEEAKKAMIMCSNNQPPLAMMTPNSRKLEKRFEYALALFPDRETEAFVSEEEKTYTANVQSFAQRLAHRLQMDLSESFDRRSEEVAVMDEDSSEAASTSSPSTGKPELTQNHVDWIARALMLKRIVHSVTCNGIVPSSIITKRFDRSMLRFWKSVYPATDVAAIEERLSEKFDRERMRETESPSVTELRHRLLSNVRDLEKFIVQTADEYERSSDIRLFAGTDDPSITELRFVLNSDRYHPIADRLEPLFSKLRLTTAAACVEIARVVTDHVLDIAARADDFYENPVEWIGRVDGLLQMKLLMWVQMPQEDNLELRTFISQVREPLAANVFIKRDLTKIVSALDDRR